MKLEQICNEMEKIAPIETALSFDNVGLLVGDVNCEVKKVIIALDLTKDVLQEAINNDVDLIITHHPLIFSPLKKITKGDVVGEIIIELIKNDIAYYASHTNLDKSEFGTNMYMAEILGFENSNFIDDDSLICVIGDINKTRDEIIIDIKQKLNIDYIRLVDSGKKQINKIAISTGSGDSTYLFSACIDRGVDLLITGDLKYHAMQFAKDYGLSVVDANHFNSENLIKDYLKEILDNRLIDVEIVATNIQKNIFETL